MREFHPMELGSLVMEIVATQVLGMDHYHRYRFTNTASLEQGQQLFALAVLELAILDVWAK